MTDLVRDCDQLEHGADRRATDVSDQKCSCDIVIACEMSELVGRSSLACNRSGSWAGSDNTWVRLCGRGQINTTKGRDRAVRWCGRLRVRVNQELSYCKISLSILSTNLSVGCIDGECGVICTWGEVFSGRG